MKKIQYIVIMVLQLCIVLTGCQNLHSPENNVPTILTGDAENITATSARVSASISESETGGNLVFLVSTSEDMNNAYETESWWLQDLTPGTTYYYLALLRSFDGKFEVRGEIKSFTTLGNFKVGKVTFTDWDGTVKEASGDYSPIGVTMYRSSGDIYHNLKTTLEGTAWNFPMEIPAGTISSYVYAYWPYTQGGYQQEGSGRVPVQTYKYDGIDYMYAMSKPNEDGASVEINLEHAMARVIFHFSIGKNNQSDIAGINSFTLSNGEKVLPTQGYMLLNESGHIASSTYAFSNPLYYGNSFEIEKGSMHDVTLYSIPTTSTGVITLTLNMSDNSRISTDLEITTASSWKKGNTYEYNVVYEQSGIILTDVTVEDWNKNEGGDITVND